MIVQRLSTFNFLFHVMALKIIFIIALAFSIEPAATAFNVETKNSWNRNFLFVTVLAFGQGLMYFLGSLLGETFMPKFDSIAKIVVAALCFMIAFRTFMDTLKIKNGKNLFFIDKKKHLMILAIALGFNPFIAGLMANDAFLPLFGNVTPLYLFGAGMVWGLIGIGTGFSQIKLIINSLVNVMAALAILTVGIIVLF